MSITITGGGVAGITIETDPTALKLTGGTLSGELELPQIGNLLNTPLVINSYNDTGAGTNYNHTFTPFDGKFNLATNGGGLTFPNGTTQVTAGLPLTGGTVSGKVSFSPTTTAAINLVPNATPASPVAGDVWMGTNTLLVRGSDNFTRSVALLNNSQTFTAYQIVDTSSTFSALRVTQRGTGNAIVVEDSTSPDSTAFVVDQYGKVGIGIAPDATACLSVDGTGINFNGSTVTNVDVYGATTPPSGWDANAVQNAIRIRINGGNYFIPYWTDPNNP
jgi:hypothetical protein